MVRVLLKIGSCKESVFSIGRNAFGQKAAIRSFEGTHGVRHMVNDPVECPASCMLHLVIQTI